MGRLSHSQRQKRYQKAVYWAFVSEDGEGTPTFASPVVIDVRWVDKQEAYWDASGEEARSGSVVYPDRALTEKGYLFLGTIADLGGETNPRNLSAARQIVFHQNTVDTHAAGTVWKYLLEGRASGRS